MKINQLYQEMHGKGVFKEMYNKRKVVKELASLKKEKKIVRHSKRLLLSRIIGKEYSDIHFKQENNKPYY